MMDGERSSGSDWDRRIVRRGGRASAGAPRKRRGSCARASGLGDAWVSRVAQVSPLPGAHSMCGVNHSDDLPRLSRPVVAHGRSAPSRPDRQDAAGPSRCRVAPDPEIDGRTMRRQIGHRWLGCSSGGNGFSPRVVHRFTLHGSPHGQAFTAPGSGAGSASESGQRSDAEV